MSAWETFTNGIKDLGGAAADAYEKYTQAKLNEALEDKVNDKPAASAASAIPGWLLPVAGIGAVVLVLILVLRK